MRTRTWLSVIFVALATLAVLGVGSTARADLPGAEPLDPETAYSEISRSSGVVLVDLYADW
jgi:hypothetical protein